MADAALIYCFCYSHELVSDARTRPRNIAIFTAGALTDLSLATSYSTTSKEKKELDNLKGRNEL